MNSAENTKRRAQDAPPPPPPVRSWASGPRDVHAVECFHVDGGGGGLCGITAVGKAFHFLDGPADVLSASAVCRRWRELARTGSVWRAKVEREGILDKAAAFEVEVPAEDGSTSDEETVDMDFYARVFVLKVRGVAEGGRGHSSIAFV